jgi:predicted phage terminase large subunit-like protein
MIIDDPIKDRKEADSETYRDNVWDWWTDAASARLAPGAPVIVILTRWHQDDLAGRLTERDKEAGWKVLNIPAQADHRPEKGETDPLGRKPGEFMVSARGRSLKQWLMRKATAGARTWASLYQGRPSPDSGGVFPQDWARYSQPMWIEQHDGSRRVPGIGRADHELVQSWDLAFKDTKSSDYVVGQVWLRVGNTAYLLDQVRARLNFTATCQAIEAMSAKWPEAVAKFVEDKANGPAVMNALSRTVFGMIPIEPEGSKYARASAISPLTESGNVVLPTAELLPNVEELLEEARNFPNSTHDDTIDALSQAINRLLLMPLTAGLGVIEPDEYTEADLRGWSINPY